MSVKRLGVCLFLIVVLVATAAHAASRSAQRVGAGTWVGAAAMASDADEICWRNGAVELMCVGPTTLNGGAFVLGGTTYDVTPATTTRAGVGLITLLSSGTVTATACKTTEGIRLCSAVGPDSYTLTVLTPPGQPPLLDVLERTLGAAIDSLQEALDAIADAKGQP